MVRIDFFGLGEMGFAMAGHLARAGHAVAPHDLDPQRVAQWQAQFSAPNIADAAALAPPDVLITSVTDAAALNHLIRGADGVAARLTPGMLWIDHTTTSPALARECATIAARQGAGFVEAPMSGGKAGAQAGTLALFAGGSEADLARARALTAPYTRHLAHLGPVGMGQAAKLAHQLAIAGTVLGLRAALDYGGSQGLAPADLLDALAQGTANSAQLGQHGAGMSAPDFDFHRGFAWLVHDLAALPADAPPLPTLLQHLLHSSGKLPLTSAE